MKEFDLRTDHWRCSTAITDYELAWLVYTHLESIGMHIFSGMKEPENVRNFPYIGSIGYAGRRYSKDYSVVNWAEVANAERGIKILTLKELLNEVERIRERQPQTGEMDSSGQSGGE